MLGVMWTCVALVLDVSCFSAALGYKARRDLLEKQVALKELLLKEKQLQQQELEKINAIYEARDADRSRIARDLHDEIGSTLSSIHIYSSVAEKMMQSDPERTKQVLGQININTRTVMENMNDIVWAMKTGDQQGILLSNKIKNLGYELLDAKNINCRYEIEDAADHTALDIDLRRNILLIVKESLNNIVKYSQATEVILQINIPGNTLHVSIEDNGRGFDMDTSKKGNGLQNIRYRVNQCGGSIGIRSAAGQGTSITCDFPLTSISDAG
jgi:signal transduction histidine kinase